ncbi:MAG: hypothetical protein ACFB6R_03560 [Alphaproteobacteria bacterium]
MTQKTKVIYDFDPNNLPTELLQAVGLLVAASSQTESIVGHFISAILGIDDAESISLTAHMSNPLKDQIARALIELNATNSDTVDQVDDLLDAINEAYERRNITVHNSFARDPETNEVFSFREIARGSTRIELKPISVDQIKEDAALIYKTGINLQRFMALCRIDTARRTRPLRVPLNRKKKARAARQSESV